jgi:phage gpG-like protein
VAVSYTAEVIGDKKWLATLAKLSPEKHAEILVESMLDSAKIVLENARRKQIIPGGRIRSGGGFTDRTPHPKRLTSRSGVLRDSISFEWHRRPFSIDVGTDKKYGAVHELGYSGPVTIKEHQRRITQAFGKKISPQSITVHAHSRIKVTYPKRPFLEPAIKAESKNFPKIFLHHWRRLAGV